MKHNTPPFDAFELGRHLRPRQSLDIVQRERELGRSEAGDSDLPVSRIKTLAHTFHSIDANSADALRRKLWGETRYVIKISRDPLVELKGAAKQAILCLVGHPPP